MFVSYSCSWCCKVAILPSRSAETKCISGKSAHARRENTPISLLRDCLYDEGVEKKNIIAVLGVPRSGRAEAIGYLMAVYHLPKFNLRNISSDELVRRGLPENSETRSAVEKELRAAHGEDYYAQEIIRQIDENPKENALIDGLVEDHDFITLKRRYGGRLHTITIHVPVENIVTAFLRDALQVIRLKGGGPMAVTDYLVINKGEITTMTDELDRIMKELGLSKGLV